MKGKWFEETFGTPFDQIAKATGLKQHEIEK